MDYKTTENTNTNTSPPKLSLYTIESAASLMAAGKIVIGKEWAENTEIQAKRQMLQEELRKVENERQRKRTLLDILKLMDSALSKYKAKDNYSDLWREDFKKELEYIFSNNVDLYSCHQELKDSLLPIFNKYKDSDSCHQEVKDSVERIFSKYNNLDSRRKMVDDSVRHIFGVENDPDTYLQELENSIKSIFTIDPYNVFKPFYEIHDEFQSYFKDMKPTIDGNPYCETCGLLESGISEGGILKDGISEGELSEDGISENDRFKLCSICVSGRPKYVKTMQEMYSIIIDALIADVDKFGLFFFPADYFKPDVPKGIVQVSAEGIRAWLKHIDFHDAYFNPVFEDTEKDKYWDILDPSGNYFAPKLAALMDAWREATNPQSEYFFKKHETPKKAMEACLKKHAENWYFAGKGKSSMESSAEHLARIANWNDKPGPKK